MERALVVVEPVDGIHDLLEEAGSLAEGVGASIVVLNVTSTSEYEDDRQAMEEVLNLEMPTYDVEQAESGSQQFADELARDVLVNYDVEYETRGAIGEKPAKVLQIAEEEGCDHIFLTGRRRSPTGKAIFRDAAQRVILNFEGPVTITTHSTE